MDSDGGPDNPGPSHSRFVAMRPGLGHVEVTRSASSRLAGDNPLAHKVSLSRSGTIRRAP